ncbi:MAG: PAS domain S-box protein [Candidatus Parabeggiatoa sp.]|nr:PAS domain S-box protein [Candidatus Parabeggiatoa sp.]
MPVNNPRHSRFFWRSSAMFGILDTQYQFKEVNSAWESSLGLSTGQLLAKSFLDFVHPDDQPITQYYFEKLTKGLPSVSFSIRFRHYNGIYRNLLWEINGAASAEYAYHVVGMDITDREQPMVADEMISVLQEGVVLQYANGTIGACNPSAERILALSADQMMGWTLIDPDWHLIREDGSPFPTETHPAICTLRTGQSYADVVIGIVKPDESLIWIRIHSYPLWRDDVMTPYAVVISFSDITHYKETEQALRKTADSPSEGGRITDNNYDLWDWDLATNEMHFSRRWEQMLGFEEHELSAHVDSWHKRIHPEDYKRVMEEIQNHLEGTTQVCENKHRLQHKDGHYRWILSRAVMVRDPSGKAHRMVGTHIDITDSRRIDEKLNEAEKKYQQLMEIQSDAIFMVDAQTFTILDVNKASTHLYGYSRNQLLKFKTVELSVQPDKMVQLIKKGMKSTVMLYHKKQNGTVFPAEVTANPFLYQGKQVLMVAVRDISERQKIETALWENESKYRQLFEATSNPTVVFDANSQHVFDVNQAAIDLYGYTKEEWLRMKTEEVSAEAVKKRGAFSASKRVIPLRWHKKKDGTVFPIEMSTGNTYLFQGRSLVCATLRDITERKAYEEALRQEKDFINSLVQTSPAFFVALNPDGNIRMINQSMLKATEYSLEEVVNSNFLTTFIPKQERLLVSTEFDTLIQSMQPSLMECHLLTQSGNTLLVEWHSCAVVKGEGVLDYFFGVGIDVTERRKAQGHLRLFKSIIESSEEAIVVKNTEGQFVYVNPAYERLLGRSFKEIKKLKVTDLYPSDSLEMEKEVKQALASGNSWQGELEIFYKDRSVFPIWQRVDAVRDTSGKILFNFTLMHDISERHRMWETVRKQWQEYQVIFHKLPAMIWYRDHENRLLRQNQHAEDIFKQHQKELEDYTDCQEVLQSGCPQIGILHCLKQTPENGNTVDDSSKSSAQNAAQTLEQASLRWLQFDKMPYQDEQGNLSGAIVFAIDITEYKASSLPANASLETDQHEALLASVFETSKLGLCLTDDRGRFLKVNQAYADLYGYRPEELVGQPFTRVRPITVHDEAVREYYSLLTRQEEPVFVQRRKEQHRNGQLFDIQIMINRVILEDKRRLLVSIVSMISDQ